MKKALSLLAIISLMLSAEAFALTLSLTGAEVTVEYDEPTTNEDGSALSDLQKTTVFYDMGGGTVKASDVPATSVSGGGHITEKVTVPVTSGQERDVQFWVTAMDLSQNESQKSEIKIIRIDRLPPAAPR